MINIKGLCKSYGEKIILEDLDLDLDNPGIYALVGPNGTGKTTLLDIIANLKKKDKGCVKIMGLDHTDSSIFKKFSYARSLDILYENLTGLDHLIYFKTILNVSENKFNEALDIFDIRSFMKSKVLSYSLGMRQKLLLTCFFVGDYDIYVMDEPTTGLDPTAVIQLRIYLQKLEKMGKLIVFSSHTLSEIDQLTEKVIFLRDKKVIREDIKKDLSATYQVITNKDKYRIEEESLDQELQVIISNREKILSIEKIKNSSEDRYKDLYDI